MPVSFESEELTYTMSHIKSHLLTECGMTYTFFIDRSNGTRY